jgi:hypothetical protein
LLDFIFGETVPAPARAERDQIDGGVAIVSKLARKASKDNGILLCKPLSSDVDFCSPEFDAESEQEQNQGLRSQKKDAIRFSISGNRGCPGSTSSQVNEFLEKRAVNFPQSRLPNLASPTLSFAARLLAAVKEKYGGKAAFAYKRAGISRKVYSKVVSDARRPVSKRTAMQFAIGLQLSRLEADLFLKAAGYAFSDSIPEDAAFSYCIENGIWNLNDLNELLRAAGADCIVLPKGY